MAKRTYRHNEPFFLLTRSLVNSPAYRDLKPPARALLIEFAALYQPGRNGLLSISTRRAEELLNVGEDVAKRVFYDLASHGFIKLKSHQSFTQRKAREWIITWQEYNGREPTNDWMQWNEGEDMCSHSPNRKKNPIPPNGGRLPPKTGAVLPMKTGAG